MTIYGLMQSSALTSYKRVRRLYACMDERIMARTTGVGAFRTEFERGLHKYAHEHPEFDLGFCAMELIRAAYDRKDDRTFFGGVAQLAKIMGDQRDEGNQGDLVLVVDRREQQAQLAAYPQ